MRYAYRTIEACSYTWFFIPEIINRCFKVFKKDFHVANWDGKNSSNNIAAASILVFTAEFSCISGVSRPGEQSVTTGDH